MTGRVLALDVGTRRLGVAVSDPTGTVASPLATVPRRTVAEDAEALAALAAEQDATVLVVGLPVTLAGHEGPAAAAGFQQQDAARRRTSLLVVYFLLAVLALVVAALFVRSVRELTSMEIGYDREHVLTARLDAFAFELLTFLSMGQTLRTSNASGSVPEC